MPFFSFPRVTEMFHFTRYPVLVTTTATGHMLFQHVGCPIRKFPGQRLLATSPKRIVGCYVLLRLKLPRHPPYTLRCLIHYLTSNQWLLNQVWYESADVSLFAPLTRRGLAITRAATVWPAGLGSRLPGPHQSYTRPRLHMLLMPVGC